MAISWHADPCRRKLTAAAIRRFTEDGEAPTCRVCNHPLKAGDFVDPHFPYYRTGNFHAACADITPARRL